MIYGIGAAVHSESGPEPPEGCYDGRAAET